MAERGVLTWLRVVDLTDLRGALCGRMLADLGADVVKVLRPDELTPTRSVTSLTAYRYRNANKRGAELDPSTPAGRTGLDALLARADVLVENLDPTERAALGLERDAIAGAHPRLVHVALTDLGLSGPRAGWRLDPLPALAASGTLHASGFPDRAPCAAPGFLAHDCASVYGAIGAVVGAIAARDGRGELVEVSAQEAALAGTTPWSVCLADYLGVNPFLPAAGNRNADGAYWVLPAADGWVRSVIGSQRQWDGFVSVVGAEQLRSPEWNDNVFRIMNTDVIRLIANDSMTDRPRKQLFEEALAVGATMGVIHEPREFVDHPQTRERGFFAATGFPGLDEAPFATFPVRLHSTPASLERPAPEPGAGAQATFGPRTGAATPETTGGDRSLPLAGVRVIEFGMAAVVPEVCGVLSELGADVIKIESSVHPDVLRQTGFGHLNQGFAFNAECRGRRSIALDLTTEEGRALTLELCAGADVVAENQRGGVMERLGLGYDDVRALNPRVVYVSSQGYGRGGPFGEMPAYGPLNNGFAGLHLLWNHPDAPYPCATGLNHPDHIVGKLLAVAVIAALDHRDRTGEGQHLDMAQTEGAAFLLGDVYLDDALGTPRTPIGNTHPHVAPHGVYPAAANGPDDERGGDRWVAISVSDDAAWERFAAALGWDDDGFLATNSTATERVAHRDELDALVAEWTRTRTGEATAELLQSAGVSAMPVLGPLDQRSDPHMTARGSLVELHHPEVGVEHHVANPLRFRDLPQRTAAASPCLGADTEDVLVNVLGRSPADVAALIDKGICK